MIVRFGIKYLPTQLLLYVYIYNVYIHICIYMNHTYLIFYHGAFLQLNRLNNNNKIKKV